MRERPPRAPSCGRSCSANDRAVAPRLAPARRCEWCRGRVVAAPGCGDNADHPRAAARRLGQRRTRRHRSGAGRRARGDGDRRWPQVPSRSSRIATPRRSRCGTSSSRSAPPRGDVRYRSWRWGAHAECFLLDCRRFRSANRERDTADKTMLGEAQHRWLLDGLARSTATFKLVFTGVPLDFGVGVDHWAGFTVERDAIFESILGIPGVVLFSADQHRLAAHRHAFGIRELQVGPLARGVAEPGPSHPGVLFRAHEYNVGIVDISADRMVVTGLGAGGRCYEETITAEQLTARRI
ncbi:MAG: alkaline phosphatase D family protein [Kofleriaceae bacterium]